MNAREIWEELDRAGLVESAPWAVAPSEWRTALERCESPVSAAAMLVWNMEFAGLEEENESYREKIKDLEKQLKERVPA